MIRKRIFMVMCGLRSREALMTARRSSFSNGIMGKIFRFKERHSVTFQSSAKTIMSSGIRLSISERGGTIFLVQRTGRHTRIVVICVGSNCCHLCVLKFCHIVQKAVYIRTLQTLYGAQQSETLVLQVIMLKYLQPFSCIFLRIIHYPVLFLFTTTMFLAPNTRSKEVWAAATKSAIISIAFDLKYLQPFLMHNLLGIPSIILRISWLFHAGRLFQNAALNWSYYWNYEAKLFLWNFVNFDLVK